MDQTFTLTRREEGGALLLYLEGPLRINCRERESNLSLSDIIRQLAQRGVHKIALDLRGLVRTPDSSGIGELVAARSAIGQLDGILVLVNTPPRLRTIISIMGLTPLFHLADTESEALVLLGENERE